MDLKKMGNINLLTMPYVFAKSSEASVQMSSVGQNQYFFSPAFDQIQQFYGGIPDTWRDSEYRCAFMRSTIDEGLAWQIRVNREQRGLSQKALALLMGTRQSAISRLEDSELANPTIETLLKVAAAFDCALIVRFASYSELWSQVGDLSSERLYAAPFGSEVPATGITNG
jgi:DNA-binding XRE family transcriptional regulator